MISARSTGFGLVAWVTWVSRASRERPGPDPRSELALSDDSRTFPHRGYKREAVTALSAIRTPSPPQTTKKPRIPMTEIGEKEIKETVRSFILSSVSIPDFKDDD